MSCKDCNTHCYEQGSDGEMCMAWTKKPVTNADLIRRMTDEELRDEWFYILDNVVNRYNSSYLGLLEWLKQEAQT